MMLLSFLIIPPNLILDRLRKRPPPSLDQAILLHLSHGDIVEEQEIRKRFANAGVSQLKLLAKNRLVQKLELRQKGRIRTLYFLTEEGVEESRRLQNPQPR